VSPAEAKRALSVGRGTLTGKTETHFEPFEARPKPVAQFSCVCGATEPCRMSACQERAKTLKLSPDDVLSGPGITIFP
jgi:hypothetical protein